MTSAGGNLETNIWHAICFQQKPVQIITSPVMVMDGSNRDSAPGHRVIQLWPVLFVAQILSEKSRVFGTV